MSNVLFVFIDGIGLGPNNSFNPFSTARLPGFERLSGGQVWTDRASRVDEAARVFKAIDACLDVPGYPQSGTGQATLFTGVNCAELAGRHFGPFPHSTSLPVIAAKNVFSRVKALGKTPAFANAYPPIFFKIAGEKNRWPVTTRSCLESETRIRTMEDLKQGRALAADITGQGLRDRFDLPIEVIAEDAAAERLTALAKEYVFTAFEYFHTDRAGHLMSHDEASKYLSSLDVFLDALADNTVQNGHTLLVTSDHGNIEDLSVKTHTENAVPFVAFGKHAGLFRHVRSLADVVPAIMDVLSG